MKDESKRQAYDLIYPSIKRKRPSPSTAQTPRAPPASTTQPEAFSEAAQIAALQKSKQERGARWRIRKESFDSSIFELQRDIRRIQQEIKNLDSIFDAEAAVEAQKNSWRAWLLSSITKKVEDTEEEKARKDRGRQERRIEKDMKERRLGFKKAELKKEEDLLRKAKKEIDVADLGDENKIQMIQAMLQAREFRQRQERETAERERRARFWKQQQEEREKREREAADALRKQQAEERAAEQKRRQDLFNHETGKYREQYMPKESTRQAYTSPCSHGGWWSKVQGRTACPECDEIWTYLLQCPGCQKQACPRCQAVLRPRIAARTNRKAFPQRRTPTSEFYYDY